MPELLLVGRGVLPSKEPQVSPREHALVPGPRLGGSRAADDAPPGLICVEAKEVPVDVGLLPIVELPSEDVQAASLAPLTIFRIFPTPWTSTVLMIFSSSEALVPNVGGR